MSIPFWFDPKALNCVHIEQLRTLARQDGDYEGSYADKNSIIAYLSSKPIQIPSGLCSTFLWGAYINIPHYGTQIVSQSAKFNDPNSFWNQKCYAGKCKVIGYKDNTDRLIQIPSNICRGRDIPNVNWSGVQRDINEMLTKLNYSERYRQLSPVQKLVVPPYLSYLNPAVEANWRDFVNFRTSLGQIIESINTLPRGNNISVEQLLTTHEKLSEMVQKMPAINAEDNKVVQQYNDLLNKINQGKNQYTQLKRDLLLDIDNTLETVRRNITSFAPYSRILNYRLDNYLNDLNILKQEVEGPVTFPRLQELVNADNRIIGEVNNIIAQNQNRINTMRQQLGERQVKIQSIIADSRATFDSYRKAYPTYQQLLPQLRQYILAYQTDLPYSERYLQRVQDLQDSYDQLQGLISQVDGKFTELNRLTTQLQLLQRNTPEYLFEGTPILQQMEQIASQIPPLLKTILTYFRVNPGIYNSLKREVVKTIEEILKEREEAVAPSMMERLGEYIPARLTRLITPSIYQE